MGLLNAPPAAGEPFALPPALGPGRKVVILGAGIAGLVSAYELAAPAGTSPCSRRATASAAGSGPSAAATASSRPAGPTSSAPSTTALFQRRRRPDPARAPCHPRLCPQLGVPIEVMVNTNRAARWEFNGRVFTNRQLALRRARPLHRAARQGDRPRRARPADEPATSTAAPVPRFYGALDDSGDYTPRRPVGLSELPGGYRQAAARADRCRSTDLITRPAPAFRCCSRTFSTCRRRCSSRSAAWIGSPRRSTSRSRFRSTPGHRDPPPRRRRAHPAWTGRAALDADYCICTLPLNLLQRIPADFSPAKRAAIRDVPYLRSAKVAFEIAALLGGGRHLWRARLDRPAQREHHLSLGPLAFRQGRAGDRLCRRLDRPGPSPAVHRDEPRGPHPHLPRSDRADASRQVADARQAGHRRLGPDALVGGVGPIGPAGWATARRPARYEEMLRPEGRSSSPASI